MPGHSIQSCRKHSLCRWIRHRGPAFPRVSMSSRRKVERKRANDPQAWVIGVLPLIAFANIIWDDGCTAVEKIKAEDPTLSAYVETDQWVALHRLTFLVKFLQKKDPRHESRAYKALMESDLGFKKVKMAGYVFKDLDGVKALKEWNDLDHLHSWIQANAVPRLNLVPTEIAEEATDVFLNTNYLDCWSSLRSNRESLSVIRAFRYCDSPVAPREAFEMQPTSPREAMVVDFLNPERW